MTSSLTSKRNSLLASAGVFLAFAFLRTSLGSERIQAEIGEHQEEIAREWEEYVARHKLVSCPVQAYATDPATGDAWLATLGCGLVRASGGSFFRFTQLNSGLAGDLVFDAKVLDASVWAATNGGISQFTPFADEWRSYLPRNAVITQPVVTRLAIIDDQLIAANWSDGLLQFDAYCDEFVTVIELDSRVIPESQDPAPKIPSTCVGAENSSERISLAIYGPRNRIISLPPGPSGERDELRRPSLSAVELTLDEINRRGGYRGNRPIELMQISPGYERYAWGLPEDDLIYFAAQPQVMGVVGYLAPDESITEAVIARLDLPWINVAPGQTELHAQTPADAMIFRCLGNLPREQRDVMDYVLDEHVTNRVALLSTTSVESLRTIARWRNHAALRDAAIALDLTWDERSARELNITGDIAKLDAVFVSVPAHLLATIVPQLRQAGFSGVIVTGPAPDEGMLSPAKDWGHVMALFENDGLTARECAPDGFVEAYGGARINRSADAEESALRSRHATEHIAYAIEIAGPSRTDVRQVLESLSTSAHGEDHFEKHCPGEPTKIAELVGGVWRVRTLPTHQR